MALEKEIINGKGVKTTYHRIDSISMVDGIKVTVNSYTDESYRQKEKEKETQIDVVLLTFLNILSILRKCSTLP